MRCKHCNFDNVPGVTTCQVCATPMGVAECSRCGFNNPSDYSYCGGCGQPPAVAVEQETTRSTPPTTKVVIRPEKPAEASKSTSPVALVGFGAILALGSAAFPWYLFGATEQSDEQTLFKVLEEGWEWYPGVPLTIIALSAVLSSLLAILGGPSRYRPIAAVALGLVTLFSAAWLWQGSPSTDTGISVGAALPGTGAMLTTMGAIVLVATLLWMFRTMSWRQ